MVLDPPSEGSNLIPGDVLWSDPSMDPGLSLNQLRDAGLLWGPDCTEEFLKKFQLKLIIRSHEGPDARKKRPGLDRMDNGFTIDHVVESGKLITLFSAPDYPQFQATEDRYRNKGAYIVLEPPTFDNPVIRSFEAITPRPQATPFYDVEDLSDSDQESDSGAMETTRDGLGHQSPIVHFHDFVAPLYFGNCIFFCLAKSHSKMYIVHQGESEYRCLSILIRLVPCAVALETELCLIRRTQIRLRTEIRCTLLAKQDQSSKEHMEANWPD